MLHPLPLLPRSRAQRSPPRPTSPLRPTRAPGGGGGGPSSRPRRQRHPPDRRRLELSAAGAPAPSRSTAASLLRTPPAPLPWSPSSQPPSCRSRVDEAVVGSSPRAGHPARRPLSSSASTGGGVGSASSMAWRPDPRHPRPP
jgi:hypothetical protein